MGEIDGASTWERRLPGVVAAAVFALVPLSTVAKPGALDPSFGTGGVAYTGIPAGVAYALALQSDGKTIVAVSPGPGGTPPAALVRLLPGGALDPSFGSGGVAQIAIPGLGGVPLVTAIVLQSDGKILICGQGLPLKDLPPFVARFRSNGSIDASFGNGGATLNVVPYGADVIAVQADRRIVVGGGSSFAQTAAVARLTPSGAFDSSFGTNGIAQFASYVGAVGAVALQTDGKYLVLGGNNAVARLLPNGTVDAGDRGGTISSVASAGTETFAFDGKSLGVYSGYSGSEALIQTLRFLRSGVRDPRFETPLVSFGGENQNVAWAVQTLPNGGIVVAGTPGSTNLGVARYRPNGTLDAGFGLSGTVFTPVFGTPQGPGAMALGSGGNITVAVAIAQVSGGRQLLVARYLGDSRVRN